MIYRMRPDFQDRGTHLCYIRLINHTFWLRNFIVKYPRNIRCYTVHAPLSLGPSVHAPRCYTVHAPRYMPLCLLFLVSGRSIGSVFLGGVRCTQSASYILPEIRQKGTVWRSGESNRQMAAAPRGNEASLPVTLLQWARLTGAQLWPRLGASKSETSSPQNCPWYTLCSFLHHQTAT